MKRNIKYTALAVASCAAFTMSASADYVWTGTVDANDFGNLNNWIDTSTGNAPLVAPSSATPTQFNGGATNNAVYDATGVTQQVNAIYISAQNGVATGGVLSVANGTLQGTGQNGRYTYGSKGFTGTLNISGTGKVDSGGGTRIGIDSGSVGIMNISGSGTYWGSRGLSVNSTDTSIAAGINNATATINVSESGGFETRFGLMLGDYNSANTGTATLNLTGGNTQVLLGGRNANSDGTLYVSGGSTLSYVIDGTGASNVAFADFGNNNGGIFIEDGAILDLDFSGIAPPEVTTNYTLMSFSDNISAADFNDGGLELAGGVDSNWSFAWVDTGGTADFNELVATYTVPEPGTFALLAGLFALGSVMVRRRR